MHRALIIDDDNNFVSALSKFVRREGYDVDIAKSCLHAQRQLSRNQHDLVLVDLVLPDGNGIDLVNNAPSDHKGQFVIITGYPSVPTAVSALRGRSADYLVKPIEPKKITELLQKYGSPATASPAPTDTDADHHTVGDPANPIVGQSPALVSMLRDIEQLAPTDATVLIQGESGTGKELVAQRIHALSGRSGDFVALNCGAIPHELIASELFGHEKGSFTGATHQRKGVFELADQGTLLLDEITEMPLDLQVNLLRVLETGHIKRVGASEHVKADVRVLAATNRDPLKAIEAGQLREDLYYRLAVMLIQVPPLRDRGDDVQILAEHFVAQLNEEYKADKRLGPDSDVVLSRYSWPGNVRELRHVIHRAFVKSDAVVDVSRVIPNTRGTAEVQDASLVGATIAEVEKRLILDTLSHFQGNKPKTAKVLGISLKTLYNRLNQYCKA